METEQSPSAVECIQSGDPSYSCGVLPLTENLHVLDGEGELTAAGAGGMLQTPLGQTSSSHLLQWWQAGLDFFFLA